jgi:hypothetical protein
MELISCNECGTVLTNISSPVYRYQSRSFISDIQTNYQEIFERLSKNKSTIIWDWDDLEQTKKSYMKYCPVCKKGTYFSEVNIELDASLRID